MSFSTDLCSDDTDNSPPLQLHTLKEFEQVSLLFSRWCQWHLIVLQHKEAGERHTALHSAILWCHVFLQDDKLIAVSLPRYCRAQSVSFKWSRADIQYCRMFLSIQCEEKSSSCWWKIPWILLVPLVCLWLPGGPLQGFSSVSGALICEKVMFFFQKDVFKSQF